MEILQNIAFVNKLFRSILRFDDVTLPTRLAESTIEHRHRRAATQQQIRAKHFHKLIDEVLTRNFDAKVTAMKTEMHLREVREDGGEREGFLDERVNHIECALKRILKSLRSLFWIVF